MATTLLVQQRKTLDFIRSYQAAHGIGPSYREIADHIGIASKGGVVRLIRGLETRRALKKPANKARCYVLPDLTDPCRERLRHLVQALASGDEQAIAYSTRLARSALGLGEVAS